MATSLPSPVELQLLALVVQQQSGANVASLYEKATGHLISPGTLYTTFRRLREHGWVQTRDAADQDGRIRFFRITASGSRALERGREFYAGLSSFGRVAQAGSLPAIGGLRHA